MRLLVDESVPVRLRRALPSHSVKTVVEMRWSGLNNGALLAVAAGAFDALITVDKNLSYQQNVKSLPMAVVLLDSLSNELEYLLPLVPRLDEALAVLEPRSFVRVGV